MANAPKSHNRVRFHYWVVLIMFVGAAVVWHVAHPSAVNLPASPSSIVPHTSPDSTRPGTIVAVVETKHFSADEVTLEARQNYGAGFAQSAHGVTRYLVQYRSKGKDNAPIIDYARIFIPDQTKDAPILALGPGTTGIGDQCAASLEQPATHNWANYESHMMAYASKGYAGVTTDYEGMRDPSQLHHYMVGEMEGRAMLDSIRALKNLPQSKDAVNTKKVFVAGYSQGGHSAFWADKIRDSYAPEIKLNGVIGWGPVMSVAQTWEGVTEGSTLNWFGPYVLLSYADYYQHTYPLQNILLPQWSQNLAADVSGHCIDTDIAFWGTVAARVYTPQFLADLRAGSLPEERYGMLQHDLDLNRADNDTTSTPKLINQGQHDNVVLPAQQPLALAALCTVSPAKVKLTPYPQQTHYNVMRDSINDTTAWMQHILSGDVPPTSCP